jgi:photosystem II stability/assembly factor-like uncharacterized protein
VLPSGTTEDLYAVQFFTAQDGWITGNRGTILASTDGGLTWTVQASGTTNFLADVRFVSATTGFAVGDEGTVLKTLTGGR